MHVFVDVYVYEIRSQGPNEIFTSEYNLLFKFFCVLYFKKILIPHPLY